MLWMLATWKHQKIVQDIIHTNMCDHLLPWATLNFLNSFRQCIFEPCLNIETEIATPPPSLQYFLIICWIWYAMGTWKYCAQRFIVHGDIHGIFATILTNFAIFYYMPLFSTKPQTKMHILTIFSLFFYNKTQLKSINIKANDRSSNKDVKTQ